MRGGKGGRLREEGKGGGGWMESGKKRGRDRITRGRGVGRGLEKR